LPFWWAGFHQVWGKLRGSRVFHLFVKTAVAVSFSVISRKTGQGWFWFFPFSGKTTDAFRTTWTLRLGGFSWFSRKTKRRQVLVKFDQKLSDSAV